MIGRESPSSFRLERLGLDAHFLRCPRKPSISRTSAFAISSSQTGRVLWRRSDRPDRPAPRECIVTRLSRKSPKIDRSRSGGRDHRNIGRSEGAVPSAGRFHSPAHGGLPRPIDAPEPGSIFATASRDCGGSNASRRPGATPKRDANVICQLAAANHRQARRTKSRGQTPEQRLSQLSLSAWKLELAGVHLLGTKRGSPDPRVKRAPAAHL